uniref:Secreted protein n=1 Tax=Steinernema glaseri TaxID=37863 RepID=A0A1I7ZN90_9BILA
MEKTPILALIRMWPVTVAGSLFRTVASNFLVTFGLNSKQEEGVLPIRTRSSRHIPSTKTTSCDRLLIIETIT